MNDFPFTLITDPAGHCITGITFDRPIPWKTWEGHDVSHGSVAEAVADALLVTVLERETPRERLETLCDEVANEKLDDAKHHLAKVEEYHRLVSRQLDLLDGPAAREARACMAALEQVLGYAKRGIDESVANLQQLVADAQKEGK